MATKKKPAPKKASKPAPKKKPVAKKPVAKAAKPAPKPAAKPVAKAVKKPVAKKPVAAKKPAPKPASKPAPKAVAKPTPKPVSKPATAPAPAPKVEAPKPVAKKGGVDPKSLVSIKQKVQPVVKKEPPKPAKVVMPKISTKSAVKYEPDFTKSVLDISAPVHSTGPVMRYSDADLTEFREIIQRKLDAAKKELSYLQGLITRKDEGGDMDEARYMTMEDGSVSMEREQLSQMASRQITFIDHLEKALMRIENKTYGICRVTGKLIDKARLRAVPHATLSMEAKQTRSN
ncbi:MAG: RNA polymerase-binding transcription factor DksA [Bacteroidetes bacterium ADurb.BinA245]|jgi:RNA polymerase-binding transcription factor DksA|nr:MAG: RNA polymerase-binding transcription factor DksA [Bacteroidetes bacterium ADurb.BinA245]